MDKYLKVKIFNPKSVHVGDVLHYGKEARYKVISIHGSIARTKLIRR